jgi:hypothetical protein
MQAKCGKCGQEHKRAKQAARIGKCAEMGLQASAKAKEALEKAALKAFVRSRKQCHVMLLTFREDISRMRLSIICE